jgi:hypothetical protein
MVFASTPEHLSTAQLRDGSSNLGAGYSLLVKQMDDSRLKRSADQRRLAVCGSDCMSIFQRASKRCPERPRHFLRDVSIGMPERLDYLLIIVCNLRPFKMILPQ